MFLKNLENFLLQNNFQFFYLKKFFNSFKAFSSLGDQYFSNFLNHFFLDKFHFHLIVFLKKEKFFLHFLIFFSF